MSRFAALLPDVLVVLGLVAVAVGAGLVYLPAGVIVGGAGLLGLGVGLDGYLQARLGSAFKSAQPAEAAE